MKIILPIHQKYIDKIISGEKQFEFRKKIPTKKFDTVLMYSCSPVSKIVGEFKVGKILSGDLNVIWEQTKNYAAGSTKKSLAEYIGNSHLLYAIQIVDVIIYDKPLCVIKDLLKSVPQSFVYIE